MGDSQAITASTMSRRLAPTSASEHLSIVLGLAAGMCIAAWLAHLVTRRARVLATKLVTRMDPDHTQGSVGSNGTKSDQIEVCIAPSAAPDGSAVLNAEPCELVQAKPNVEEYIAAKTLVIPCNEVNEHSDEASEGLSAQCSTDVPTEGGPSESKGSESEVTPKKMQEPPKKFRTSPVKGNAGQPKRFAAKIKVQSAKRSAPRGSKGFEATPSERMVPVAGTSKGDWRTQTNRKLLQKGEAKPLTSSKEPEIAKSIDSFYCDYPTSSPRSQFSASDAQLDSERNS